MMDLRTTTLMTLCFGWSDIEMSRDLPLPPNDDLPPISRADLKALFDHLDRPDPVPCTHTFKETAAYLKSQGLPVEATLEWLGANGAGCDVK